MKANFFNIEKVNNLREI
jgi:renal tumor antigen